MFKKYFNYIKIKRIFFVFLSNPIFFVRRVLSELKYSVKIPPPPGVYSIGGGVNFNFDFNYSRKIKDMYFGTYQKHISDLLKRYLKKGDTFIDVGANIGYFTALGASLVGKEGVVHSFEPVTECFEKLKEVADLNKEYKIIVNQFALGDQEKKQKIFVPEIALMERSTFFSRFLDEIGSSYSSVEVSVHLLDEYIKKSGIKKIKLIKIDAEGAEYFVLKGLSNYFLNNDDFRPFIICEISPDFYKFLGWNPLDIFNYMEKFSYYAFNPLNTKKRINIGKFVKGQTSDIFFKFQG